VVNIKCPDFHTETVQQQHTRTLTKAPQMTYSTHTPLNCEDLGTRTIRSYLQIGTVATYCLCSSIC
jgi:hypothetical protein